MSDYGTTRRTMPGMVRLAAAIVLCGAAVLVWMVYGNSPAGRDGTVDVVIAPGMTATAIARTLRDEGLIRSVPYFVFVSNLRGYTTKFKAGRHPVDRSLGASGIALLLTRIPPPPPAIRVTVVEGLTIHETAPVLEAQAAIDSTEFVRLANDGRFAAEMGVDNGSLEGYLYPDTYFVHHDTGPRAMIERMVGTFRKVFDDSLMKRAAELDMTVHEVVTLASIIETEAGRDDERPLISSVFHRRMERGRPLEANPTIQYALGEKRRVLKEDLDIDSPYNTYTHRGLPPGPIASPGRKSILAALYPADTKYLYFMADGKGGHVFSRSLREHNNAVRSYKRLRKRMSNK